MAFTSDNLRTFLAVLDTGSFSAAARQFGLTCDTAHPTPAFRARVSGHRYFRRACGRSVPSRA